MKIGKLYIGYRHEYVVFYSHQTGSQSGQGRSTLSLIFKIKDANDMEYVEELIAENNGCDKIITTGWKLFKASFAIEWW